MMHTPVRTICRLVRVGVLVLLVAGCSSDGVEEASEWTVEEGTVEFTETLRAGDDEEYFLGSVSDVAVDGEGGIYVLEEQAAHIKVLEPGGAIRDTIGRKGEGPGEFQNPSRIVIARSDSIYVLDTRRSHVSAFASDGEFAYSFFARYRGVAS